MKRQQSRSTGLIVETEAESRMQGDGKTLCTPKEKKD